MYDCIVALTLVRRWHWTLDLLTVTAVRVFHWMPKKEEMMPTTNNIRWSENRRRLLLDNNDAGTDALIVRIRSVSLTLRYTRDAKGLNIAVKISTTVTQEQTITYRHRLTKTDHF